MDDFKDACVAFLGQNLTRKTKESSTGIETLGFSLRTYNCLKRANINSIADLTSKTETEMLSIRSFGDKLLSEVSNKMKENGIALRSEPDT